MEVWCLDGISTEEDRGRSTDRVCTAGGKESDMAGVHVAFIH